PASQNRPCSKCLSARGFSRAYLPKHHRRHPRDNALGIQRPRVNRESATTIAIFSHVDTCRPQCWARHIRVGCRCRMGCCTNTFGRDIAHSPASVFPSWATITPATNWKIPEVLRLVISIPAQLPPNVPLLFAPSLLVLTAEWFYKIKDPGIQ